MSISNFGEFLYVGGERFRNDSTFKWPGFTPAGACLDDGALRLRLPEGDAAGPALPIDVRPMIVDGLSNLGLV